MCFFVTGSPFAEDKLRSSTLDQTDSTSTPSLSGSFSSFRNLTKAGVGSKLTSLKKSSTYLSSYLSPSTASQKKAQEALTSGLTSVKSAYSSVSKRVEEIRVNVAPSTPGGMSPATSYQYLTTPDRKNNDEGDSLSNTSNDSRRPSNIEQPYPFNDQSETWGYLTSQLWDQFWGADAGGAKPQNPNQRVRTSDISEQYEQLYMKMPKRLPGAIAMEIQMTSCSKCLYCHGILFDEEIMGGWTADDSNLNTKCLFCERMVVPFLTIKVIDYRTRPMASMMPQSPTRNDLQPPKISDYITVPYLSPLVLRKELENMLETEGDMCLLDPKGVDSHPIIFWNLLWFFERIAVKSHLPGLCLSAKSLNPSDVTDSSWTSPDHRNVQIRCRWDNERLHQTNDPPLYTVWQANHQAKGDEKTIIVSTDVQDPAYKGIMSHIISGVESNDLLRVRIII